MNKRYLAVDLDGTLIKEDLLIISLKQYLKKNFLNIFNILLWSLKGVHVLKHELAKKVKIDVEGLNYNKKVIKVIRKYETVVLATGSSYLYAKQIEKFLKLFDFVIASNRNYNNTGVNKANNLIKKFGYNFDYIGNSKKDIPIWQLCNTAFSVNKSIKSKKINRFHYLI